MMAVVNLSVMMLIMVMTIIMMAMTGLRRDRKNAKYGSRRYEESHTQNLSWLIFMALPVFAEAPRARF